ncbi:hypothetical protein ES705_50972 [subsurface metagenome]
MWQIFAYTGTGTLAGTLNVREIYPQWWGAIGDGVTDDTTAIQNAIAMAQDRSLYFPSGNYKFTTLLDVAGVKRIYGDGVETSTLNPTGCHGLVVTGQDQIAPIRGLCYHDFGIYGDASGAFNGIYIYNNTYSLHDSTFRNIRIGNMGGRGIYIDFLFCTKLENITVDSCGDHAIEIAGGNTVLLEKCYAHNVAPGKAGYRIWGQATLISCNGLDTGDYWGI